MTAILIEIYLQDLEGGKKKRTMLCYIWSLLGGSLCFNKIDHFSPCPTLLGLQP